MYLFVVLALVALLLALLACSRRRIDRKVSAGGRARAAAVFSTCPLCGAALERGERVYTAAYPGINERMVHIFGCPYCYPRRVAEPFNRGKKQIPGGLSGAPGAFRRVCPVCHRDLGEGMYLVGRMGQSEVKTYVRVLGCSRCTPL